MELSIRLFVALLVIASLWLTLRLLKSRGVLSLPGVSIGAPKARRIELEERLMVSAHQGVCLLKIDGRPYILTIGPGSTSLLPGVERIGRDY
ncbi:MAG: hypothetical protein IPP47_22355 [Bryobacterales bacterium]|nr:hypothetical protein [Bryobacterales bacterium]